MCNFFSIITRGDGIPLYINLDERKKDPYNSDFDSHSYIAEKFIKESELKNFNTQKGKCDIANSYEIDFEFDGDFKITNYKIKTDTINIGDDSELLKKNIENLLPEFNEIVKYYFWDRFVENPNIEGNLNLSGTPITKLPDNLKVGGDLYLRDTKITELPKDLKVGGDLYLRNTPITKLPDNLTVGGGLDLSHTPITKLPGGLKVGGDLFLYGTKINKEKFIKPVGVKGRAWV